MKSLLDLPAPCYISEGDEMLLPHITIPQLVGPDLSIVTQDVIMATKILGIHFSPAGNLATHVEHMVQKGLNWVDCLSTKPVSRQDARFSFFLQLFPGMSWGLVTICLPPKKFDRMIQRVYEKALLFLDVNLQNQVEMENIAGYVSRSGNAQHALVSTLQEDLLFTWQLGISRAGTQQRAINGIR